MNKNGKKKGDKKVIRFIVFPITRKNDIFEVVKSFNGWTQ